MGNIIETIRGALSGIVDKLNQLVEPYVKPVVDYINGRQYITLAFIFLGLILLLIPGIFAYIRKAFKFLVFLIILFTIIFIIIRFV
ncbi:MAG: hypothetical protein GX203_03830 [Acholeplasmataceae bacterium]|nr:hypothetical protein [Acholeplasmataceae bacterium]HPT89456.1 hypothetical protein [Bacilli bacterium]HQA19724.1 hypothetical protein [Bacilli bacterium]HQD91879.1 hypothetical protein [Bacilli bacterium]